MWLLASIALVTLQGAGTARSPEWQAWTGCLDAAVRRWAPLAEPAATLVDAAFVQCERQHDAVLNSMFETLRRSTSSDHALQQAREIEANTDREMRQVEIAYILDLRAASLPAPRQ
ncbi:MAG: hypothetical protein QOJ04_2184 [Caballeronia sp.]|jgi:hypothetical protein|nr:hypothetical protein [Caballeronia sp.]